MTDTSNWDWETKEKLVSDLNEWKSSYNWVEEPYVSPDGEKIAAIVNTDDMEFNICENGKAWEIATPRLFFREEYKHIDAMLFGAPSASAWTLLNPSYTVVVPKPVQPPLSRAFPISKKDRTFELFMRNWINMKMQNRTLERLFDYWIRGKSL